MRQGQKEVISFMGPPGSGKGTVAQQWQHVPSVSVLSTGALCRKHVREKTSFGKEFSEHLAQGNLIPDELISRMVRQWLVEEGKTADHLLLDGYPRTQAQVGQWIDIVSEMPEFGMRVVLFELADEVIVNRLSRRLVCANASCQAVYNTDAHGKACAACSGALIRRPDDEPEVIKKRLAIYAQHKAALLEAYREHGIAIEPFNVEKIALNDMFTQFSKLLNMQPGV